MNMRYLLFKTFLLKCHYEFNSTNGHVRSIFVPRCRGKKKVLPSKVGKENSSNLLSGKFQQNFKTVIRKLSRLHFQHDFLTTDNHLFNALFSSQRNFLTDSVSLLCPVLRGQSKKWSSYPLRLSRSSWPLNDRIKRLHYFKNYINDKFLWFLFFKDDSQMTIASSVYLEKHDGGEQGSKWATQPGRSGPSRFLSRAGRAKVFVEPTWPDLSINFLLFIKLDASYK